MTIDEAVNRLQAILSESTTTVVTEFTKHKMYSALAVVLLLPIFYAILCYAGKKLWNLSDTCDDEYAAGITRAMIVTILTAVFIVISAVITQHIPDVFAPKAAAIKELIEVIRGVR